MLESYGHDHVLADGVERAAVLPGEQDVPLVGALVDAVHGRADVGALCFPTESAKHGVLPRIVFVPCGIVVVQVGTFVWPG